LDDIVVKESQEIGGGWEADRLLEPAGLFGQFDVMLRVVLELVRDRLDKSSTECGAVFQCGSDRLCESGPCYCSGR
jgi:hypothetical protein